MSASAPTRSAHATSPVVAVRAAHEAQPARKARTVAAPAPDVGRRLSTLLSPRSPEEVPALQSALPSGVQAQMQVSSSSDPSEREADSVARAVMSMQAPAESASPRASVGAQVHRSSLANRTDDIGHFAPQVQRKGGGPTHADADVEAEIRASLGGGSPLPPKLRQFMEPRFRADFSGVRIHTDGKSAKLASRLSARAFAYGRDIFFGGGEFRPDSLDGGELIAHELTHTIQQRAVVQRQASPQISQTAPPKVQRLGIDTVLDFIADKANIIPGFRMFTIVLGVNPINMSRVEASPANILRAVIEFIPGGGLITQALDNSGIFEKVANWAAAQIKTLGMVGSAFKQALMDFLDSLGWRDLFRPGQVWNRAKKIFTAPIDQLKSFVKNFVTDIVQFIKDAILKPIAKLAEGRPSYDLLKGVMGKDPITGEPVTGTADLLIGGFMKLIGQQDVWQNMQKSGAIPKAWAWFKGAMSDLVGFVLQIPPTFVAAFKSLELVDIILVPRAFAKLVGVFGTFLGRFVSWAGNAVWNLLEIIFSVVAPGALGYVKRTGAALKSILKNPIPFVRNLVKAGKQGFQKFADKFRTHLTDGLVDWLTGSLTGVYIPKSLALGEIVKFAFSVLGLTWANLRERMVNAFGEPVVAAMEKGFDIVVTLVTKGPVAAWEQIKEELIAQKDKVVSGIMDMVIEAIVTKAIPKLVAMFIPGAGFISAIVSIYDTIMVFVQKISKIIQVVTAFLDSIIAIAAGKTDAAANKVESILKGLLSLAINFLAGFAGLGKIASKINGIIEKIRAPVFKAMDSLVAWIKKVAGKFLDKLKEKAAALVDWWKEKSPFKNADGESHTVLFQGTGDTAKMSVKSDLMSVEAYLDAREKGMAADDKQGRKNLQTARSVFDRAKRVIFTPLAKNLAEKARRQQVKSELAKVSAAFAALAGGPPKASDYPKSTEPDNASHTIEYIVGDAKSGSKPSQGPNTGTPGWKEVYDAGLTTATDKWVQMHVISEQLGGKGIAANLVSAPNSVNTGPFRAFEHSTKALAKAKSGNIKNVVWVKVDVTMAGNFAKRVRGQSGLYFWKGASASPKWLKNEKYSFFSQAAVPDPQLDKDRVISLNFSSSTEIARARITSESKLIELIKQGRRYPTITVFIARMEVRAKDAGIKNYKAKIQTIVGNKKVVLNEPPAKP
ncbi:eCIS core domain-containing protein [Lysobacter sp. CA199]|uniref:eCIS core domain-containing protein n=1 Tax=Lysobacter sp. CA199 TaxID=3455608 RepID=UPI003F8D7532